MEVVGGFVLVLMPFVAVIAVLAVVELRDRRHRDAIARQIALTDAVHARFGAIVAPTVRRKFLGRWQVEMPIPPERAEIMPALFTLAREAVPVHVRRSPRALRIVFTSQAEPPARLPRATAA